MKRISSLALIVAAFILISGTITHKTAGQKGRIGKVEKPIPNRYIVLLDENTVGREAVAPEVEARGQFLTTLYGGQIKEVYADAIKGFVLEMSREQAESMNLDPSVSSIEPDREVSVASVETNAPWHLDRIDQRSIPLDTTFNYTSTGAGVHVYVLDTGIRATHTDFGGRADAPFDSIGDGQNGNDCHGHGTHVAGIVGGTTYGVAKNASIHGIRVLPCGGTGALSNIVTGINWVTANHQSPAVANISITAAGVSTALETAVANSIASGVTYTIAAGNSAADACNYTPARAPNAITVGATSDTDIRPGYSNYGTCLDIFAPGHAVVSLSNANDTDVRPLNGTSQAAPIVAGVAALYLSSNPSASPATVTNAIKSAGTTGKVTNLDGTSSPNLLLYSVLSGIPPATPTPTPTPTATPTPTPTPTPAPPTAMVRVRKMLQNASGTSSSVEFPYTATNLSTPSFALVENSTYEETNIPVQSGQTLITVRETAVAGWRLASISCSEASTGQPTVNNTTTDLVNRRANIVAEPGENILCTFTSEPFAPTAANVSVGGRVVSLSGNGIIGAKMVLLNTSTGQVRTATTNAFGYYVINDVPASDVYVLSVSAKRYRFANSTATFTLNDSRSELDFVANQ